MRTRIFLLLACLSGFLLSCTQDEGLEGYVPEPEKTTGINIPISLATEVKLATGSELRPMGLSIDTGLKLKIRNGYKALFLKEIDNRWYVDTLVSCKIDPSVKDPRALFDVRDNGIVANLNIALRPGNYRAMIVLNPDYASWNPAIVPGLLVKDFVTPLDSVPYAFTYQFQQNEWFPENLGERMLMNEIFTGIVEFTIDKTGDLHTPNNTGLTVNVTRKVMRYRLLLKNNPDSPPVNATIGSPVFLTLVAEGDARFCDGVNCWGSAHYHPTTPTRKMDVRFTIGEDWVTDDKGNQYLMCRYNAHNYSPYLFADDSITGVPYKVTYLRITGASGGFTYQYFPEITGHTIKANTIDGVVVEPTTEVVPEEQQWRVTLRLVEDENPATLFDAFYEWTHAVFY